MNLKTKFSQSYGSNQKSLYTLGEDLKTAQQHEDQQYPTRGIVCKVKESLKVIKI